MKTTLRQKAVILVLILAMALSVTAAFVSYRVYAGTMDDRYKTTTMQVAQTAAAVVNKPLVRHYTEEAKAVYLKDPAPELADEAAEKAYMAQYASLPDADYETLYTTLDEIKQANDVLSLYIVYYDVDSMTCVYIIDADRTETGCPMGTWDIVYEQNYDAVRHPENGMPSYITNSEEYGWLCSAGAPIFDEDGSVIAQAMVDISMDAVMQDRQNYLARLCMVLAAVTVVLLLLLTWGVNRALVRPINLLASATGSFVAEVDQATADRGQSAIARMNIHTGDEIEKLCDSVKTMEQELYTYIDNLTRITAEKERLGAELSVATQIQADMLPTIFPPFPDRTEFDIFASMTPAKEVGGDFYDFFLVDDDHLAMVMADVSGKGVPAALFMVISKTLLKNEAQTGHAPAAVLEKVNNQLCENNDAEMFVTAWLGIYEISTGRLQYANAGHEYPAVMHSNGDYELVRERHGFVLAGMENVHYKQHELTLQPGDRLFLYTDGVPEATNAANEMYGTERMLNKLNACKAATPQAVLTAIHEDLNAFVAGAPQFDDITMLGLTVQSRGGAANADT